MKKIVGLFICILALSQISLSQNVSFQQYFKDGLYKFDDGIKILKSEIFQQHLTNFGFSQNNQMVFEQEGPMDNQGGVSGKYVQYCNGYKVENTHMNVISQYGVVLYVNGHFLPELNVNVSNPISEEDALTVALQNVGAAKYAWEDARLEDAIKITIDSVGDSVLDTTQTYYPKGELLIARPWNDTDYDDTSKYHLCWKFIITPMSWDTVIVDSFANDTLVAFDTVAGYMLGHNKIVYVDALTEQVYSVDPNTRGVSGYFENCSIEPTYYHGNQTVQGFRETLLGIPLSGRFARDSRGINLEPKESPGLTWGKKSNTWPKSTEATAFWCFQKSWDYYSSFWGFTDGPNSYNGRPRRNEQKVYVHWPQAPITANGSYHRVDYQKGVGSRDTYHVGEDFLSMPEARQSAAHLDIIAHEYTHAMIYGRPNFNSYGDAGAIAEGFCDYLGIYCSSWMYPSRYISDWNDGFGVNTGDFARFIYDPTSDYGVSGPGFDHYVPVSAGDVYRRSGVLRKVLGLCEAGGTHNGITVAPMWSLPSVSSSSLLENQWVAMYWWTWNDMSYYSLRDAFLAVYELYHGKCSPKWKNVKLAFASVGLTLGNSCPMVRLADTKISFQEVFESPISTHARPTYTVVPTEDQVNIINYNWILPAKWHMRYTDPNNFAAIEITDVEGDYSSQMISCVVTYGDSTTDTVTTFHHFVGEDYEQRIIPKSQKEVSPEISVGKLEIFPNPTKSSLTVQLPFVPARELDFRLFDMVGREVCTRKLRSQVTGVALPELPAGIYTVRVTGDNRDFISRVTIQ